MSGYSEKDKEKEKEKERKEQSRPAESTLLFCGQAWASGRIQGSSSGLVSAPRGCTLPYDINMSDLPLVTVQSPLPLSWMHSTG